MNIKYSNLSVATLLIASFHFAVAVDGTTANAKVLQAYGNTETDENNPFSNNELTAGYDSVDGTNNISGTISITALPDAKNNTSATTAIEQPLSTENGVQVATIETTTFNNTIEDITNPDVDASAQTNEIVGDAIHGEYTFSTDILTTKPSTEILNLLTQDGLFITWQGFSEQLRSLSEVKQLYAKVDYRPLWTNNGHLTRLGEQLILMTREASEHALRPEVYHTNATAALQAGQAINDAAKLDILLTDAFITYKSHLTNGIVNPKTLIPTWTIKPRDIDYLSLYLNAYHNDNLGDIFVIGDGDYRALQTAYVAALAARAADNGESDFEAIPTTALRPGTSGEAVAVLRRRLGLDDSIDLYDDDLREAVRQYQREQGLAADGIAGKNTVRRLNRRPQDHLKTLAINMERRRWSYVPQHTSYVDVNIPAFKMAIKNGNQRVFESNVIVGRRDRPTPVFSDTLENVVLAPYWNVPSTIFKKDKLPRLRKNPNALGANMQVINTATGKVVSPGSVNWASGGKGYRLRQKPGARNALGAMKFMFPNRHAIYMHDTPNKKLFKRSRRAFSSGCIRVQRAEDLAVFLLEDMGYSRDRVKKESRRGKEKWVSLEQSKRYPVFLNYYTAWVDNSGQVRYSSDIYGHDKPLQKLYQRTLDTL